MEDAARTPFNDAVAVRLLDFTETEAAPLEAGLADLPAGGAPYPVEVKAVRLYPQCAATAIDHVDLHYRVGAQSKQVELSGADGTYHGSIPAMPAGTALNYSILTSAGGYARSLPDNRADDAYSAFVGKTTPLYCNDFEAQIDGWTFGDAKGKKGDFQWGTPIGKSGDPPAAFSGVLKMPAATATPAIASAMKTVRQPKAGIAQDRGVEAVSAPSPPAAMMAALSEAWRSMPNHWPNALNEAIRQADTPSPISARPAASPAMSCARAKTAAPVAAKTAEPERAAQVCGIPVEQIRQLARDYGTTQPAAIRLNYGMQRVHGGANAVRAVACLPALTGAWRHRAGGVLLSSSGSFPVDRTALQRPDLLAGRSPRTINMVTIGDDLLRESSPAFGPKIEALVVYNSNPVAVAPDSSKVVRGFAREDLFTVVLEHFQTDTADYADYVLPATTQLEHWDVHVAYGHTDVLLNQPAIAPLGQARSNTQVFRDLAARMGFTESCFQDSDEQLCRQAYGAKVDFNQLLEQGFAPLGGPDAPFAEGGFPTPSGKCEFFSERLAEQGLDGLPDHVPNHEAAGTSAQYPLAMISPPARNFLNSTFVNVKSLRDIEGRPLLEIHPHDAAARGIQDGSVVRVFNGRGSYRCHAHVSERARPGVVNGLGIWWRKLGLDGSNVNQLTSQALTDLGRGPTFYDCLVEVEAAGA